MRQYTTTEQTAKLIELGLLPKQIQSVSDTGKRLLELIGFSIGELIEMLDGVSELEITRYGSGWGAYDELRAFTGDELIDALYAMVVKLKEEGVI